MAKKLVIVAGTNKIVRDDDEANDRLVYQWKLESARARVAFKIPASTIGNTVALRAPNPFIPNRVAVILVRKALGF